MPGFRPALVVIHPDAQPLYDALEADAAAGRQPGAAVWKSFLTQVARVKRDGQAGEVIPRSSIPAHFVRTYGAGNLYCLDLASFRRCFYTIRNREVVFLDVVDHARYDRWFPGKRK